MRTIRRILTALVVLTVVTLTALAVRRVHFHKTLQRLWRSLEPPQPASETFTPALVAEQPEPVQRYFLHAIAPGTRLATSAELAMSGEIKLGDKWMPFTAQEIMRPFAGFIWKPTVSMGEGSPLFFTGADSYVRGAAQMRFDMFGLIPLINNTSDDVRRSAIGRLAGESIWVPTMLLPQRGVQWEARDANHINATMTIEEETVTLTFTIDEQGAVRTVVFDRWHTDEQQYVPFGFVAQGEATFGGCTIPARAHLGWWYGSQRYEQEGKFFTCSIEQAHYR